MGSFQLIFLNLRQKVYFSMSRSFATQALSRTANKLIFLSSERSVLHLLTNLIPRFATPVELCQNLCRPLLLKDDQCEKCRLSIHFNQMKEWVNFIAFTLKLVWFIIYQLSIRTAHFCPDCKSIILFFFISEIKNVRDNKND